MSMTKHGNTFAPGDPVTIRSANQKLASASSGTIESVDPDTNRAKVKTASGTIFVDLHELERA